MIESRIVRQFNVPFQVHLQTDSDNVMRRETFAQGKP